MSQRTKHIQIPLARSKDVEQQRFNEAVRQALNMMGGTKADRVLTVRDVMGGSLKGITLTGAIIDPTAQPGYDGETAGAPTIPTNVQGFAGMDITFLRWDRATFPGFAYTEVYRFDADSLALATRVATVTQPQFSEYLGFGRKVFYWVRHVNVAGRTGPFHATNGVEVETKPNYEAIQAALSEQIDESYLAAALRAKIELLNPENDAGLIAAQAQLAQALDDADARLTLADQALDQKIAGANAALAAADTRLSSADAALQSELDDAKTLFNDQLTGQASQIVFLQQVTDSQALELTGLSAKSDAAESSILTLQQTTAGHASRLTSIETVNGTQSTNISNLQTTTATHATAITRLGAYDATADKYAFIKTLEEVDATQASQISGLTTRMSGAESSITTLNSTTATQATNLTNLTTRVGSAESGITELNTTTAGHASRLTSIETVNGTQSTNISNLQTTTATHATAITRLGAYDATADKYAFIKTLEEVDATQASQISGLTTRMSGAESSITTLNSTTATQATNLTNLTTRVGSAESSISSLNTTTANQASNLTSLSTRMGSAESSITTLNTTTANQASSLSALTTRVSTAESGIVTLNNTTAEQASKIQQVQFTAGDSMSVSDTAALSAAAYGENVLPIASTSVQMVGSRIRITGSQWLYTTRAFKVDTSRKYKIRLVVKQITNPTVGGSIVYAGVSTMDGAFNALTSGPGTHRYCAGSRTITVANGRQIFEGVITGEGDSTHNEFRPGTVYVRPMLIVNYNGGNGVVEIESIEIRDITETAVVEDIAKAYTDNKTGEIRAERTIKVQADGRVAGIGLIAGTTTGTALYFTADRIAILPPGASSTTGAKLPFIYDSETGAVLMDTTFIRDLTASKISGGILNLSSGNIRDLTIYDSFSPPDLFLHRSHLSDDLARQLAWVDPNAVQTGGTVKKAVPALANTTSIIGSFLSGGLVQTVRIYGSGPSRNLPEAPYGYIDVQLLRNNQAVTIDGVSTFRFNISSYLTSDEALPPSQRTYGMNVEGEINGLVGAVSNNTQTEWKVKIVATSGLTTLANETFIHASVFEAFASSGGIIANTSWGAIADKPATATRWPAFSEVTGTAAAAQIPNLDAGKITTGVFAAARIPTGISITGNAGTVTNGVYTTGTQSIGGNKTFTSWVGLSDIRGDSPVSFLTLGGGAREIRAGKLLVSDSYNDNGLVPANGIYAKGQARLGSARIDNQIDVLGHVREGAYRRYTITLPNPGAGSGSGMGNGRWFLRVYPVSSGAGFIGGRIRVGGGYSHGAAFGVLEREFSVYTAQNATSVNMGESRISAATGSAATNYRISEPMVVDGWLGFYVWSANSNAAEILLDAHFSGSGNTIPESLSFVAWAANPLPAFEPVTFTSGAVVNGTLTATNLSGNGANVTNVNAATLSGFSANSGASGNTIALRDSAADVTARLFRSNYQNESGIVSTAAMAFRNSTTDNYIRFCSNPAAVRGWLSAPSNTGDNASGTWGISISGTAAVSTALNYQATSNQNLDTAATAGRLEYFEGASVTGAPNTNWHSVISVRHNNASNLYGFQLAYQFGTDSFLVRGTTGSSYRPWLGLYTDNYHPEADKLTTARTIGGVSFDGTANINLPGVNTTGNQNTTGNAASATVLQTSRNINRKLFNGSQDIEVTEWFHSFRDFPNGTLVTTDINYAVSAGDPWVLEVKGNSYSSGPSFDLQAHGYIYSDTLISVGGVINGFNMTGIVAMNIGGNLCFWWPRYAYWQGFNVRVYTAHATQATNRVVSITDSADPGGTKRVTISDKLKQSLREDNFSTWAVPQTDVSTSGGASKVLKTGTDGYLYLDNWIRSGASAGLHWTTGSHFHSTVNGGFRLWGGSTATYLELGTAGNVVRGSLYANSSNEIGLVNNAGSWIFRGFSNGNATLTGRLSSAGLTSSSSVGIEFNTLNGHNYAGGSLELKTNNGSSPSLGFHRSGFTACQLRHDSNGLILSGVTQSTAANFRALGEVTADGAIRAGTLLVAGSQIQGISAGTSWIDGHRAGTNAAIRITNVGSVSSFHSWISQRTPNGGWAQGVLGDSLYFNWATNANIDGNVNQITHVLRLTNSGEAFINGNVTALDHISTSDIRTKRNLAPISDALKKLMVLTGYTFDRNGREAGYIAQDLERVLPEGVTEVDGLKRVSNSAAIGLIIEAIKELAQKVEALH